MNAFLFRLWISLRALLAVILARVVRLVSPSSRAPLAGDADGVDPMWLTRLLWASGVLPKDTYVASARFHEGQASHRGLASETKRIEVLYDIENDLVPAECPRFLILKRSGPSWRDRHRALAFSSWREGQFYNAEIVQAFSRVVPHVYYAYGSQWLAEIVVVMEDGTVGSGQGLNAILGDQTRGDAKSVVARQGDTFAALEQVWGEAAKVHASYWCDQNLLKNPMLRGVGWKNGADETAWTVAFDNVRASWNRGVKKWADVEDVNFDERLVALMNRGIAASTFATFQQEFESRPWSLCHGDFHAANMLVLGEKAPFKRMMWVDWSEVGIAIPAAEIGQMVISDLPPALFSKVRPSLKVYWTALTKNGVDYPFEDFLRDFEHATIAKWMWYLSILIVMPLPASLVQYFHDQVLAFVEEFGDVNKTYTMREIVGFFPTSAKIF